MTNETARRTRGPWIYHCGRDHLDRPVASITTQRGDVVASLSTSWQMPTDALEANAHLIAAAPEMYEALRTLSNLGDASIGTDVRSVLRQHERMSFDEAITAARAALAKAEGRS